MELRLLPTHADALRAHAAREAPHECCGVLLGRRVDTFATVSDVRPCANVSVSPETRYEIAPRELVDAQRAAREAGTEIVGFYHSHPCGPAQLSPTDLAEAAWPDCVWVVVDASSGDMRAFTAQGEEIAVVARG